VRYLNSAGIVVDRPMALLAVFAASIGLVAGTHELTPKDFDDKVFNSGKGSFIKFLAPW